MTKPEVRASKFANGESFPKATVHDPDPLPSQDLSSIFLGMQSERKYCCSNKEDLEDRDEGRINIGKGHNKQYPP